VPEASVEPIAHVVCGLGLLDKCAHVLSVIVTFL
jgi:hypothetical protein